MTAENAPEAVSAVNAETRNYWIFYKNIDTEELDRVISEKSHAYEYSLYDTVTDSRELERMVTDYSQRLRLDMLKEAFGKKSAEILAGLGVDSSAAFCSMFTPTIVCPLTDEQYEKAKSMELIKEINVYDNVVLKPTALYEKEDILNEYTRDRNGKSLCDDHVKFDVVCGAGKDNKKDFLIVYGLKSEDEVSNVKKQLDRKSFWENPIMELYSGVELCRPEVSYNGRSLIAVIFVEDELPGWSTKVSVSEFSARLGFDAAPYIVSLGDCNGDYRINALDASEALCAYSRVQTDNESAYTADELKHLDTDKNGTVDAVDASSILAYYAFTSTGGNASIKSFLGK